MTLSTTARAILLMVLAVCLFSTMDAQAKLLSERVGTVPALWARYIGQALLVFVLVLPRIGQVARTRYPLLQLGRSVYLLGATALFFFGISHIGLAEATAIMTINPVFITLGAVMFLGENVGIRRALAIGAACVGALLVIRPGSDVFSVYSLLPLGAAVCYSAYNLTTRVVGRDEDPWTSLFYTALFGAVVLSAIVPAYWQTPGPGDILLMAGTALAGTLAQLFLIRALIIGEAAMLAPFSYAGLIFSTIYGLSIFGDVPGTLTILGAAIIVFSGLYVWYRETVVKPH